MDDLALRTLHEEMRDDCRVAQDALVSALARFDRKDLVGFESCAHHLCRLYNAFEQMGLRVAKIFENNLDDEQGWHSSLLNRIALEIPGVRPALIPSELKPPLKELKAFRHVFVHAYELELDPDKLSLQLKYARQVVDRFPELVQEFIAKVRVQQGIADGGGTG